MLTKTHPVDVLMSALTDIQNHYPGSSAHLILHTSGGGALVFERSLLNMYDEDNNRLAIDFDAGLESDAVEAFRAKIVAKFGT
jgi:hypothetical protein